MVNDMYAVHIKNACNSDIKTMDYGDGSVDKAHPHQHEDWNYIFKIHIKGMQAWQTVCHPRTLEGRDLEIHKKS